MIYAFGECVLDTRLHILSRAGQPVSLRPKAFEVLVRLLTHRDRVVSKQELCDQVWPEQFISDATLGSTLRAVRQAIGDSGGAQRSIQTVHGYGYRCVAAVTIRAEAAPEPATAVESVVVPTAPIHALVAGAESTTGSAPTSSGAAQPCSMVPRPPHGERKFVTVLSCALADTAALLAQPGLDARHSLPGGLYEHAQNTVQHYSGAQLDHWRQAGEQAVSSAAYQDAVTCFEQALRVLQELPAHPDTHRQAIELRFHLSNALMTLGEFGRARDALRHAQVLAESLEDGRQLGRACTLLTAVDWLLGDYQEAFALGRRALAIARVLEDFTPQVHATLLLGQVAQALGDYQRAQDYLRRNIACLDDDLRHQCPGLTELPAVLSRAWLAWCLAEVGAFAEGMIYGEEGVQIAEAADHPFSLAMACCGVGLVYLYQGDVAKATARFERSLALCQGEPLPTWFPLIAAGLGLAYARGGRAAAAALLLEQAVERATVLGFMGYQALRCTWLSEAYLVEGRLEEARQSAERALKLARDHHEQGSQAYALHLLGAIATHHEPPHLEAAEAAYRQALALAEALGMQPLLAHCHLGLSTLYRRCGRLALANTELATARALFRTLDMPYWLQQVAGER